MVQRIDKELLRKRAEHNDGELSSLREVTLHQYDIEKIENLDVYCRHLEILFLQNNQIAKIENLNKLKELKYLQLALNNITKIENLEGCEALEKLDLTVNFVEDPLDVESLKGNEELKDLYLLGNPCAKKEGYREYVITALPQLKMLDGRDITRTERIEAAQLYDDIRLRFLQDKEASSDQLGTGDVTITDNGPDVAEAIGDVDAAAKRHNYQTTTTAHTPSARLSAARDLALLKNPPVEPKPAPIPAPLFTASGRLLQKNQGKWTYNFTSSSSTTTLHVHLSKFIDTSLLDVEVERDWIRVTAKGKVLQLVLEEPSATSKISEGKRSKKKKRQNERDEVRQKKSKL
ncbi:hypothetical protein HKX48_003865 [Thoreauomyces humboldtii]|nr:hypothetical protein HKX48_003865 [Thoreauomyces humboldtii]